MTKPPARQGILSRIRPALLPKALPGFLLSCSLCLYAGLPALTPLGLGISPAHGAEPMRQVLRKESIYNTIFVFERGSYRYLKFGSSNRHYTETIYNPEDRTEMPSTYTRHMTLAAVYAQSLDEAVVVGMGGGRTSWYMAHFIPDMTVTGVELDPEIVKIADEYFDVRAEGNLQVAESDGRIFFRRRPEARYDIIQVDAYRGPFVPFHLLTQEFYQLLEDRLSPGGVVVQNIEPSTMLFDHALATIGSVFDTIDLYIAGGNVVAVAHDGPRRTMAHLQAVARERQAEHGFRYDLLELLDSRVGQTPEADSSKVLTDDFAPANYLRSVESHNRRWEELKKDGLESPLDHMLQKGDRDEPE